MLTINEALERVLSTVISLDVEQVPLEKAYNRILAQPMVSPINIPPWDNSAMDGYALLAADTSEDFVELTINEVIGAGAVASKTVVAGTASAIMTGAPMPAGADSVVMIEKTNGAQSGTVVINGLATVGQNVRPMGGDIQEGSQIIQPGQKLTPAQVGVIASMGFATVPVYRKPVIALLTTGDEIIPPGQALKPGQIYSSNNAALVGVMLEAGAEVIDFGIVEDNLDVLVNKLSEAALQADLVVTTGGVSMGVYDFVKEAFVQLGNGVDFWKVKIKPGKPLAFGKIEAAGKEKPLFGLPGNPVSCMVNFHQFVAPWLAISLGQKRPYMAMIEAVIEHDLKIRSGRVQFIRVLVEKTATGWTAKSTGTQSSGALSSMALADGLMVLPADSSGVSAGETVRIQMLSSEFMRGESPNYS